MSGMMYLMVNCDLGSDDRLQSEMRNISLEDGSACVYKTTGAYDIAIELRGTDDYINGYRDIVKGMKGVRSTLTLKVFESKN